MSQEQPSERRPQAETATGETGLALIWSDALLSAAHDPLEAARLQQGHALLEACDVLRWRELTLVPPDLDLGAPPALSAFHDASYVENVEALSAGQATLWSAQALGFSPDITLPFPGMATQAQAYVAATRTAVRCLIEGTATQAASIAGNQPHAAANRSVNGDVFNDVLLALNDARAAYDRVAFVSLEAEYPVTIATHFANDPGLLFVSLHEAAAYLYPGAGYPHETGRGDGRGYTVNLPLAPGAGPGTARRFWPELVRPLLERFEPQLVVLLLGATAHYAEPLAHLAFTIDSYVELVAAIAGVAPRLALLGGDGSLPFLSAELWTTTIAALVGRRNALPRRVPARFAERFGQGEWSEAQQAARYSAALARFADHEFESALHEVQQALAPLWGLPVTAARVAEREAPSFIVATLADATSPAPPDRLQPADSPLTPRRSRAGAPRSSTPARAEPVASPPSRPPDRSKKTRPKRRRRRGGRRGSSRGTESGGS